MIGAIIGDIVGSIYEFNNHRSKDFELFDDRCFATDDSIMSLAIGDAIVKVLNGYDNRELSEVARDNMQNVGENYPYCGYGGHFFGWIMNHDKNPYNSYGNGAAMRVCACGEVAETLGQAEWLAEQVTKVSHNHPEGIKGAQAVAGAVYLAKVGEDKETIKDYITQNYYTIDFTCDEIRDTYEFNETCQRTVPQALECFFESTDFEDAIRTAISIGGDSDTIGAITGAVAGAYYNVPTEIKEKALTYLDARLRGIYDGYCAFCDEYKLCLWAE